MTLTTVAADPMDSRPRRSGEPLISAAGVWKIFGPRGERLIGTPDADLPRSELRAKTGCVAAVRDVSLEVWPGEVFVVMGLSGSGKSTLVRTLIRLIEPTAGAIAIADQQRQRREPGGAAGAAPSRRLDGLPAFRPARPPARDRQRRLRPRDPRRRPRPSRLASAREMLRLVGLEDVENSFPDQLSGGMQQRVGVARAFVGNPTGDALRRAVQRARPAHPPGHAGRGHAACRRRPARRWSSSPTTCPRRSGSATASRSCATARSCSSGRARSSSARPRTTTSRTSSATSRAATCSRCAGSCASPAPGRSSTARASTCRRPCATRCPCSQRARRPIVAVRDGEAVGVVDRVAVLKAIAGEGG